MFCDVFERFYVGGGQIAYVHVVADTGSVARIVVAAEYFELFAHTAGDFHDHRQKVCGVLFEAAEFAVDVVTCRVEIAERCKAQASQFFVPRHKLFDRKLRIAVIIFGMFRMAFVYRKILRFSEYGCGRRKHHALAAVRDGCI